MKSLLRFISKLPFCGTSGTRTKVLGVMASKNYEERIKNLRDATILLIVYILGHGVQIGFGVWLSLSAHRKTLTMVDYGETMQFVLVERWLPVNLIIGITYIVMNLLVVIVEFYLLYRIWRFHCRHPSQYPKSNLSDLMIRTIPTRTPAYELFSLVFTAVPQIIVVILLF